MKYRVVDLRTEPHVETEVDSIRPEKAAAQVLGFDVVRGGAPAHLVAKVYWQPPGFETNMVRVYRRVGPAVDRVSGSAHGGIVAHAMNGNIDEP